METSKRKIWFNGKLIDWGDVKIHVLTQGLHYGYGVFEGIRCYDAGGLGAIFRLEEHVKRLFYSAECLSIKIPFSEDSIKAAVTLIVKENNLKDCYIRPIAFCGYGEVGLDIENSEIIMAIIAWPWGTYLGGKELSAVVSSYKRLSPRAVPIDAKVSGYYVNSILASTEAKKHGVDEAILLDEAGFVAEGSGENIFSVKGKDVYTPAKGYILPGLTRDSVIRVARGMGLRVVEKNISVDEIKSADEVFFTGTAIEICPVIKIDDRKIGDGKTGPVTLKIQEEYRKIIRGQSDKYKKWLTLVK